PTALRPLSLHDALPILVGGGDTEAGGVDVPVEVGESVTVASAGDVAPAGTPVLSVAPATVSVGGVSARDAGGSDELKTEHAASRDRKSTRLNSSHGSSS